MKLLVVEDDQFLIQAYQAKAEASGDIELELARDGEQGLAQVEKFAPEVIILDLVMPKMDGFEFLKRLRESGNKTPVIVSTNLESHEQADAAMAAGANDFFVKSNSSMAEIMDKARKLSA